MNRRVVVTGIGVISAIGANAAEFWQSLKDGRSGIGPVEAARHARLRCQSGAEVRGFDPREHFPAGRADLLDRATQFALVAAREAVADAGLEWTRKRRAGTGVVTGSCLGAQAGAGDSFTSFDLRHGDARSFALPRLTSPAANFISAEFGLTGPSFSVSTGCSAAYAVGQACWMMRQACWLVRRGRVRAAIVGGCEAPFSLGYLKSWAALGGLSADTCRPFSRDRSGIVLGEGAAMMVLEPLDAALARGAKVYAEVVGFGVSSDADSLSRPSAQGAAQAMRTALLDAGLRPDQIGYINAHAAGEPTADAEEAAAIRAVFGSHADRLAVSATKSMHGHALGATGALEAVATVLALRHGVLPPIANFTGPDPYCDLDVIANAACEAEVEYALSNSFAFGGANVALAFRRWGGSAD
jgi:nodulation protein E